MDIILAAVIMMIMPFIGVFLVTMFLVIIMVVVTVFLVGIMVFVGIRILMATMIVVFILPFQEFDTGDIY